MSLFPQAKVFNNLQVRIVIRITNDGHPFSELFYTWEDAANKKHYAYTRTWYKVNVDAASQRQQLTEFIKRMHNW